MATVEQRMHKRLEENEIVRTFNFDWPAQEEVTVRLRDILEGDVEEKFYLSKEKTAKLVAQLNTEDPRTPDESEPNMLGHIDLKGHDAIKRVYSAEGVSPTLTTMGGGHREPKIAVVRSVGNTNPSGNGMNGQVFDIDAGLSPTLTTNKGEGVKIGGHEPCYICSGAGKTKVSEEVGEFLLRPYEVDCVDCNGTGIDEPTRYRIRKLTPRECFRLQGFPDSEFDKLSANGISNSQLYKQAGNAVTVNVIDAIGRRLLDYVNKEAN